MSNLDLYCTRCERRWAGLDAYDIDNTIAHIEEAVEENRLDGQEADDIAWAVHTATTFLLQYIDTREDVVDFNYGDKTLWLTCVQCSVDLIADGHMLAWVAAVGMPTDRSKWDDPSALNGV